MDLISSNSPTIHSASNVEPPTSSILSRKRTHSITSNHSTNSNLKPSSSPPSQDSSSLHSVHSTNSSLPRPSSILTASSSYFSLRAPAQLGSPRYFPFLLSPLPPGITWTHVFVLALACSVIFGNYYCYDLPASLNVSLQDQLGSTFDTFQYQLNLLYTVYSLPNIVLPLISGYLVDTLGVRRVMMVLATLVVISAIGFATSYTVTSFIGLVVSRFMLGVGGESLEVVSATVLSQWFQSTSWMTLAFALQLSSSRLATVVQDNVTPLFITRQWTEWA
ncbi:hypothetical protein HMI55_006789 [Coelomomyces lativittatus]|nr:hypothetical protein HMI55_006789 [Coelomomyces lativittatus]